MEHEEDFERVYEAAFGRIAAGPRAPRARGVGGGPGAGRELRALPLTWRKAIVLHQLVGMPVDQAARTLGVPAGTVKTWLARGRRALAARLGEQLGEQQGAVHRD